MSRPDESGLADRPLVTIIMPVFNRAAKAVAAVQSVGLSDRRDVEIIVVDDGSTDGSPEAVEAAIAEAGLQARAIVLRQKNAGPGAARNHGARHARGAYLAFLDSDDLWMPWTAEVVVDTLRAHPEAALFFLQEQPFADRDGFRPPAPEAPRREVFARFLDAIEAVWSMPYASCNAIIRRSVFDELGGFTAEIRCAEDTDLFLRADPAGTCVLVHAPPMVARETGEADSLTANVPCVVEGLDFLVAGERAGRYPGGARSDAKRALLLAGAVISTTRAAFAQGFPALAYGVLLRHGALLPRGGRGNMVPRLLLTPALARLKPQHYRFRWRPVSRG